MGRTVIVAGARTPIGKFRGAFATLSAMELGGRAIRAAVDRARIAPEQVDYTIFGHVLQAGQGQITSLQASIAGGLPKAVPAITLNKVCLSGMSAIAMADQMIRAGEIEVAVAGGMESMTNAPYALPKARGGSRLGDADLIDTMLHDGLWSSFRNEHMGAGTDEVSSELGLSREEQDAWAVRSHRRAADAWSQGRLTEEVVAVEVPQRKGDPLVVDRDQGIRADTSVEVLAGLKPAFRPDGTITAGNASQISDGACAVVVMSEEKAEELGLAPIAEIVAYGMSSDRYPSLQTVPAIALERALKKAGLAASDLGLVEINEAFAAVPIHSTRMLGVDEEIVNVNGGAVALGHPIGASGARIVLALAMEMGRRGVELGGAAICGGGGQGDALVLRRR
ncbi:MAG TPA: acetyl-CoA C-acetyltransferase [Actinomycetota bacterium]|jgi:acetyl-CoA C-acetyltransferase|nr:acetyl-CoA C-acetyltransferase [Actinomycetota bacterium]